MLIGSFLFSAANTSYQSLLIKQSFAGKRVRDFMNSHPVTVPSDISLQEFVDRYLYSYHYKMFPVMHEGEIEGLITLQSLKSTPHEAWKEIKVAQIIQKPTPDNTISAAISVQDAFYAMNESGITRMLVKEHHKIRNNFV